MIQVRVAEPAQAGYRASVASRRGAWRWQHWAALVGAVLLAFEVWTLTAWISKGPYRITEFRDTDSLSWTLTRVYEAVAVVVSAVMVVWLVRGCRRAGRLTFDAKLCLAGFSTMWLDPFVNFYQPVFLYSSNWTNLNNWCSQAPFAVNPDCGRMPEPIVFVTFVYTFGLLLGAMLGTAALRWMRRRFPGLSTAKLVLLMGLWGAIADFLLEGPAVLFHLWNYYGTPDSIAIFGGARKFPLAQLLAGAIIFGALSLARASKDDRGDTIFERGLAHLRPRRRAAVSLLAMVAFFQSLLVIGDLHAIVLGPYSSPWPDDAPRHIVNGLCDAGGFQNTRYGPCPGSPGYTAPIRHLPGPNPPEDR